MNKISVRKRFVTKAMRNVRSELRNVQAALDGRDLAKAYAAAEAAQMSAFALKDYIRTGDPSCLEESSSSQ